MTPSRGPAPLPAIHWTTPWATPFGGWLRLLPMLALLALMVHGVRGQVVVPQVAAGGNCSAALSSSGRVWTWGSNAHGQFGTCVQSTGLVGALPQGPVPGLNNIVAIACGSTHMMALTAGGQVLTWGSGNAGVLGQGTATVSLCPQLLPSVAGAIQIAVGCTHSLILLSNGTVLAFGEVMTGALGLGATTSALVPTTIPGLTNVIAISAGYQHSAAVLANGTVKTWGDNAYAKLGFLGSNVNAPTSILGLTGITAVSCGAQATLLLDSTGVVRHAGAIGPFAFYSGAQPLVLVLPAPASAVSVGRQVFMQMALLTTGAVCTWGTDCLYGSLGGGTTCAPGSTPLQPAALSSNMIAMACGERHCLAISQSGAVTSWGLNSHNQLGYTTTSPVAATPAGIPLLDLTEFALYLVPVGQNTDLRYFFGDPWSIYANVCTMAAQTAPHTGLVSFGGLWLLSSEVFMWASLVQAGYPFATGAIDSAGMAMTTLPIANSLLSGLTINAVSFNLGVTGITHTSPVVTHTF